MENEIDEFVLQKEKSNLILQSYNTINDINVPSKLNKFPYNIVKNLKNDLNISTYKSVSLTYIKNKNYYVEAKPFVKGGDEDNVFVFYY